MQIETYFYRVRYKIRYNFAYNNWKHLDSVKTNRFKMINKRKSNFFRPPEGDTAHVWIVLETSDSKKKRIK